MIWFLLILLLILCIFDLLKNKSILSPRFIFNSIFFITCSLYQWDFSYIQQVLSNRTIIILLVCVISFNITYFLLELFFNKKNINIKSKLFDKGNIDKKVRIAKYIAIAVFILELIYSRGCPLLWKFTGDPRTYFEFGIPSLNGAFYGLIICLGAYSIFSKSKDKYIYIAMGLLMISRQVIMSIFIEGLIFYLLNTKKKIDFKKLLLLGIVLFAGFTLVGNFRSGSDAMNNVFMPKRQYDKLPSSVKWTYSYMTFSISNFNNLVSMTDGGVNKGASMLSEFMPTVILNKINIKQKYNEPYLVMPSYNVSTYLPSIYLDFGIIGIAIFNILLAIIGYFLYRIAKDNSNEMKSMLYAVYSHNILLLFFINMFLYLPIMVQFVYILLIFSGKKEVKEKKKVKNILFVGTDSNLSGASLCMVSLVNDLRKEGYNPIIVLPKVGEGLLYDYIKKQKIECHVIKSYNWVTLLTNNKYKDYIKYFIKKTLNIFAIYKIRRLIKKKNIDTVHINTIFSYVGAEAALEENCNLVWHIREILEYGHSAKFYDNDYAYDLINKSDKIITISNYVNNYYKKYLDFSKMSIVYDGLETEKYYIKNKKIFTDNKYHFVLVGTIQESKGQKELLKALSLFKKNNKDKFELTLIGYSTSKSKEELENLIKDLGLTKEVKYLGFKKNSSDYYKKADIGFMCSSGEAFGRITVEACLAGCLVIGANIGATKEIIKDNETGLLYKSGDPEDLANKIEYAINNKDKMKKIAAKSREYSNKVFTAEKTAKEVIYVYNDLGGKHEKK